MKRAISLVLVLAGIMSWKVGKADFIFGTPTNLGPTFNSSVTDGEPDVSADGLTLYFNSYRPGGYGDIDIWVAMRDTTEDDWGTPVNLGPSVNSSALEAMPSISTDGLTLYFNDAGGRGGFGGADLYVTTRDTIDADWGAPVNLGPTVNTWADEISPCISADGLQLYFSGYIRPEYTRPGGYGIADLWVTTRPTKDDPWEEPVNLGPTVNTSANDGAPSISADGRTLFFLSDRLGGYGHYDLWMTRRATTDQPWEEPVNLGPQVNTSARESAPDISADGSTLYFNSDQPGGSGMFDICQVKILPVVDFNDDGNIDTDDLLILIGCWRQNEPLCDIGPTPLGDGIVDIKDLEVFMGYWEQENVPEVPDV